MNHSLKPPLPVQIGPYAATLRIHHDERGVAWIDNSNVKVVEVILDFAQGYSPEKIQEEHSHLSLAQIYAAIAYYQDYKQEVDDLIQQWDEEYQRLRAQATDQVSLQELEERLRLKTAQTVA